MSLNWGKGLAEAAQPKSEKNYLINGKYLVELLSFKEVNSKRSNDQYAVWEVQILEVIQDRKVESKATGTVYRSHAVGDRPSYVANFRWRNIFDVIKAFLCAIMEISPEESAKMDAEEWSQIADRAFDNDGEALRGSQLIIDAEHIEIGKPPTKDFTKVSFYPATHLAEEVPF
tara:strand:+ start:241 stop:759 length:519 start_codon:yes stop_codon:yes gene_type:complete